MKVIDLLNKIANTDELPNFIKFGEIVYKKADIGEDYYNFKINEWFFKDVFEPTMLNERIEFIEEDKDIPLIPDDELFLMKQNGADIRGFDYLDYNFKVLQEKINQVVKEFNEYRKENE